MTAAIKSLNPSQIHFSANTVTPIRVMVVEDSLVFQNLIRKWLNAEPDMMVVASHRNGRTATDDIHASKPDVVVLDIEMPEMDGLTALPLILEKTTGIQVLIVSTLTKRNARISVEALLKGASDYIPKPGHSDPGLTPEEFKFELIRKVRALGEISLKRRPATTIRPPQPGVNATTLSPPPAAGKKFVLRSFTNMKPAILAVGASTGGVQAMFQLFQGLKGYLAEIPVVLTQHMPPKFTNVLAENLSQISDLPAKEGEDGEPVHPGIIYVAPGGVHMSLRQEDGVSTISILDGAPINYCKPAVDPLFASVAEIYQRAALCLVLTGMGRDGCNGARQIAKRDGNVLVQDEKTSVIWGMPGACARAGICNAILPINEIAGQVKCLLQGRAQ